MDSLTHAVSGALVALAIPKHARPTTRLFIPLAIVAALLPDADIFFIKTPMEFLLLHRGISHALIAVPFMALLLTLIGFPLWVRFRRAHSHIENGQIVRAIWPFWKVFLFFCGILLLHLWLDCVTTFGTMIFLPFSEYRVRLNGLFIIDLVLTIPLILAAWNGGRKHKYAVLGLIWILVYPASCVALRYVHEAEVSAQLKTPSSVAQLGNVQQLSVLPDVFSPFYWRVVYQTDKPYKQSLADEYTWPQGKSRMGFAFKDSPNTVYQQGLSIVGTPRTPLLQFPALHPTLAQSLKEKSRRARAFEAFSLMPIQECIAGKAQGEESFGIYDLRFGSMFMTIYDFLLEKNNGRPTFLMEARRHKGELAQVRLIFSSSDLDSGWQNVSPPQRVTWWQWMLGIGY